MKRIFMLLTAVALLFTSCSLDISSMRKDFFSMNDNEIADQSFEKIIEAIQTRDSDALKSLFSDKALEEAADIDEVIDELFDFYQGQMLSYDDMGDPIMRGGINADGRGFVIKELRSRINVETSEKKYHFAVREFVKDTEFPDNIGIYAIYIVETDILDEPVADWWMKDGVWIPGIAIGSKQE